MTRLTKSGSTRIALNSKPCPGQYHKSLTSTSAKGFREYFERLNRKFQTEAPLSRSPITAEVIQVAEGCLYLPPVTEAAEVQRMINSHNQSLLEPARNGTRSPYGRLKIKRTIFYTGYLISNEDSNRLISQVLNPLLSPALAESNDLKYMANCILITPRPATRPVLDKVGGVGKKLKWQVTGAASYENRVWAARLSPIPETEKYYTENPYPMAVLAVRKGARPVDAAKIQNWLPVPSDKAITFETVVGEKVVLRVEEDTHDGEWAGQFMNKSHKRRHQQERDEDILYPQSSRNGYDDPPPRSSHYYPRYGDRDNRQYHDEAPRRGPYRGRGRGSGRGRGFSGRGGRGRGRGRDAGPPGYRSLDDHTGYDGTHEERRGPGGGGGGGGAPVMNY